MPTPFSPPNTPEAKGNLLGKSVTRVLTAYPQMNIVQIVMTASGAALLMAGKELTTESLDNVSDEDFLKQIDLLVRSTGFDPAAFENTHPDFFAHPDAFDHAPAPAPVAAPPIDPKSRATPLVRRGDEPTLAELRATIKVLKGAGADPNTWAEFEERAERLALGEKITTEAARVITEGIWTHSKFAGRSEAEKDKFRRIAEEVYLTFLGFGFVNLPQGGAVLDSDEVTNLIRVLHADTKNSPAVAALKARFGIGVNEHLSKLHVNWDNSQTDSTGTRGW